MKHLGRWAVLLAVVLSMGFLTGCEPGGGSGGGDDESDPKNPDRDRARITGTWKVVTPWRWSQMTFKADGSRTVVDRLTGEKFARGSWKLKKGKLVVVSDVTEEWDYVVTRTSLTVTLPSGNVIRMVKKEKGDEL